MEESPESKVDGVQHLQDLIGQHLWEVENGHLEIFLETSFMLSYLSISHIGNLEQALYIFGYLKSRPKRKLDFEPAHPTINENRFQDYDLV